MMKFYKCSHCGNIVAFVENKGVPVMCCGQKMDELVPNTTDAAGEKHVPVYEVKDGTVTVTVGSGVSEGFGFLVGVGVLDTVTDGIGVADTSGASVVVTCGVGVFVGVIVGSVGVDS